MLNPPLKSKMSKFLIFALFPNGSTIDNLGNKVDFDKHITETKCIIDWALCEKDGQIWYDKDNFEEYLDAIKRNVKSGSFNFSPANLFRKKLQNAEPIASKGLSECMYVLLKATGCDYNVPLVIQKMAEEKYQDDSRKAVLLNLADALNWHRRIIPVLKDCYQIDINCRPQLAIIEFVATWQDLGKWFRGNQIKRALNTNDNRHRDRSPRKSPLLYNLRDKKENARCEDLLQTALTNPEDHKDLVNFDDEKECFIWFECEGTNNQYHAYHLVKSEKGERDISSKGERKISDTLRHVFEHLHPGCFR